MKVKLPSNRSLILLQYVFFISAILYIGRSLFVPVSFALLISCFLYPACVWLEKHKFSRMSAIGISLFAITLIFVLLIYLMFSQITGFFKELPGLQEKLVSALDEISSWLSVNFNLQRDTQMAWLNQILEKTGGNTITVLSEAISASAVGAILFILIPIYAVLILYYRHKWLEVIYRIFPTERRERIREIAALSIHSYYNFIKGMALVYLMVGILNSVGLYALGIPHALLFGFTASILTFIPYVGILIASLLPITMAWITYNSIWYALGVVGIFAFVQYLEANLIFPLAVSSRLKLNAMVTILSIFAGAILWGVSGMILFIPFVGILKLVADRTPSLKTLSIILGDEKT
jgi:predicted PurR-regulated permease PerM